MLFPLLVISCLAVSFNEWSVKYNKQYSLSEQLRRKAIYNKNAAFVRQFNKNHSFKISTNGPFADLTNQEYRKILTYKPVFEKEETVEARTVRQIPDSVDWRSKMPAVRDQAQCGSCWAFSSVGALEGRVIINEQLDPNTIDYSEQQLVDCGGEYNNKGCNGGSLLYAYRYIKQTGGVEKESDYPYQAVDGTCAADPTKFVATFESQHIVTQYDETALATAVADGPVAVAIDAGETSFQLYTGGIYDEPKCHQRILNHGVITVGYGTEDGVDYWIVRNSWGSSWGESGYIRMVRNKNNQCGIATDAIYISGAKTL